MPAKYAMTWEPAPRRWRKMYRGQVFTVSAQSLNVSDSKEGSYRAANEWWQQKKAEIDAQADADKPHRRDYEIALQLRREMLEWMSLEPDALKDDDDLRNIHDRIVREVRQLEAEFARPTPPALNAPGRILVDPVGNMDSGVKLVWLERVESLRDHRRWTQATGHDASVAAKVDEYLERRRADVGAGQIKSATYKAIRDRLPHFKTYAGNLDASKIDERTLSGYQSNLTARVAAGDCSPQYAAHLLSAAKALVRWLWRERVLEHLPRNLDGLTIRVPLKEIKTFEVSEVKTLLKAASERTRVFMLLMINCGMYQSDIAALKPSQVDWERGRISRKRTKGEDYANAPTVNYVLWPETVRLLKEYGRQDGPLVFMNKNGSPIYRRPVKADGKVGNVDNIKKAYERLCKKLKIDDRKPLMCLRKTSATLLETHEVFGRFAQYFLGQAPASVAEERYSRPSKEQFDRAMNWLGQKYGL